MAQESSTQFFSIILARNIRKLTVEPFDLNCGVACVQMPRYSVEGDGTKAIVCFLHSGLIDC